VPSLSTSRKAPIVEQFRYARFTLEDYNCDQELMRAVDQAACVTFGQFRLLAKRQNWTVDSLVAFVKGQLEEPKRTIERILKIGPVDTVIPYTCLIELYQKTLLKPEPIHQPGYCKCGCGQRVIGRQKFATDACRKRAARMIA
jgi:hypothetical protein